MIFTNGEIVEIITERDDLRAEVKRLNAELTETERLRDDARVLDLQHSTAVSGWEGMKARAEAAEAKVAAVKALVERTQRRGAPFHTHVPVSDLVEALASVGRTEPTEAKP